jgi:hypothetical protein
VGKPTERCAIEVSVDTANAYVEGEGQMRKKRPTPTPKHYDVGYRRPPRQFRFRPGQSGNPTGTKRKTSSIAPDLKALLQRALSDKVKLGRREREQIVTNAAAGIDVLVAQFVEGDHRARRDLISIAERLGIDLTANHGKNLENTIAEVVSAEDDALLAEYVEYHIRERRGGGADNVLRLPKRESSSESPVNPGEKENVS